MRTAVFVAALVLTACHQPPAPPTSNDAGRADADERWRQCFGCEAGCGEHSGIIAAVPDERHPDAVCDGCECFCGDPSFHTIPAVPLQCFGFLPHGGGPPVYDPSCDDGLTVERGLCFYDRRRLRP